MSAFGVVTADGAALGFSAFGFTDEAGALGLIEFGHVAAGAEPGIGTYTPCAVALVAVVRASQARFKANPCRTVEVITLSKLSGAEAPTSGILAGSTLAKERGGHCHGPAPKREPVHVTS